MLWVLEIYQWLKSRLPKCQIQMPKALLGWSELLQDSDASWSIRDSIYIQNEEPHHHVLVGSNIFSLDIVLYGGWEDSVLEFAHQLVSLLRQAECQDGVRQNSCEVGQEALVDGEDSLRFHCLR